MSGSEQFEGPTHRHISTPLTELRTFQGHERLKYNISIDVQYCCIIVPEDHRCDTFLNVQA